MVSTEPAVSTGAGRLERRKARTRASILDAARTLFSEQGYDETAIQQIAERADTGVGTLYGYFASKEDILKEVLKQTSAQAVERYLTAVSAATPAIDRICRALATFGEYIRENQPILVAAFQVGARKGTIDDQQMAWLANAVQTMIAEGIAAGTIKDLPATATARTLVGTYLQAMLGLGVWKGLEDSPETGAELEKITRALLLR